MEKKVLILGTGGTIASLETENGLKPGLTAENLIEHIPQLEKIANIDAKDVKSMPVILSSNMQPEYWAAIARDVFNALAGYDGIVITQGTDTLAYTSSMLSFMLQGLNKPIIITGAMKSMIEPVTDAKRNLVGSVRFACEDNGGVYVVFNDKIMKGCRAYRMKSQSFDAFYSIGYPDIGYINSEGEITYNLVFAPSDTQRTVSKGEAILDDKFDPNIFLLKLIPGTRPEMIDKLLELGYKGIIIESFGDGGIPSLGRNILPGIRKLIDNGVVVVVAAQPLYESADLASYEDGRKTLDLGVIPAYDMTKEAIVTKLMWVMGHTDDIDEVRKMMLTNYCGELSIP